MIGLVKGLWGDQTLSRRGNSTPSAFCSICDQVKNATNQPYHAIDKVYVFGLENAAFLKSLGYKPVILSQKAWASPKRIRHTSGRLRWNGAVRDGYSYWWHKLKIIEAAFQDFSSVLWMDFDVHQLKDDLRPILTDLEKGKRLRAPLYKQYNWTWGAGWRHKDWNVPHTSIYSEDPSESHIAAQTVLGCGFLFFGNCDLIKYALELQDEFPHFLDHQIVSLLFDRLNGGEWIGHEKYIEQGWHTTGFYYSREIAPPRRSRTYFQSGQRGKKAVQL